jgi:hypothetical protein
MAFVDNSPRFVYPVRVWGCQYRYVEKRFQTGHRLPLRWFGWWPTTAGTADWAAQLADAIACLVRPRCLGVGE